MSKKLWFGLIVFAIIGVAIGWYCAWHPQQVSGALTLIQNPSELLPKVWSFIQQHWQALTTGFIGLSSTLMLAAYRFNQLKQQTDQTIKASEAKSNETITTLATQKTAAETQLTETTKTYSDNLTKISTNYAQVQGQLQDVTAERDQLNKQLIDQRGYIEDLQRKLERMKVEAGRVA